MLMTWLRGLAQLRHPEVVRFLGERRQEILLLERIRRQCSEAKLADGVVVIGYQEGRLALKPGSAVATGTVLACGDEQNGFGKIVVGERTWIGQYNNLRACGQGDIVIGKDCLVSQFCTLVGSNHSLRRAQPIASQRPDPKRLGVVLGDDVWLGASTTVTPGITIGRGVVIGANSVVTKHVPDYEIWAGSPARKIGERA